MELTTSAADSFVAYDVFFNEAVGQTEHYVNPDISQLALSSVEIYLNSLYTWSVGASPGSYDLQSVTLHELGHALGVAHCHEKDMTCQSSTCSQNVMNRSIPSNTVRTTFQYYDIISYRGIYS